MNAHVTLERLKVAEVRSADLTRVRFLSGVYQHMGAKMGHLDKSGPARLTLVWLFSRVNSGVGLEICWSVKLSTADVAMVWLCTGMNSLMAGQVALVAEGSLAAVALVWLVAVDLDHVVFQGIFLRELGVASIAEINIVFTTGGGII